MDEEVTENWEDLEDSGELDRRLDKIKVKPITIKKRNPGTNADQNQMAAPALIEDTQRSVFQPQLKILKRNSSPQNAHKNHPGGSKAEAKSLKQREAAYAEARMRIFGAAAAAQEPDDESEENEAGGDYSNSVIARRLEGMRVGEAAQILRQPTGPDGTKGFAARQTSLDR